MNRRHFVQSIAALPGLQAVAQQAAARLPIRKAVLVSMLPKELDGKQLPYSARFQLAREIGFEAVECQTIVDEREAGEIQKAAASSKLKIHSVMNMEHWASPLSSSDAAVVQKSMRGMETSLRNAHMWGAETVLLVPAVVNAETSYADAWKRSQKQIRELIPLAERLKVIIAVENVWNKFLTSPVEFAQYVDEFKSPWVKAYFDVGNVVLFGFPQDWIRTLGPRIVKLHIKDFSFKPDPATKKRAADFCALREGDIDWKAVHQALGAIGYKGAATVELPGGDKPYLEEVSRRFDLILTGA